MENVCPQCGNQCPKDDLKCPRGMKYFGAKMEAGGRAHSFARPTYEDLSAMPIDDAVITLMRKCGHYLHHSVGNGKDMNKELLSSLSEEEKSVLIELLQKCTRDWE